MQELGLIKAEACSFETFEQNLKVSVCEVLDITRQTLSRYSQRHPMMELLQLAKEHEEDAGKFLWSAFW